MGKLSELSGTWKSLVGWGGLSPAVLAEVRSVVPPPS